MKRKSQRKAEGKPNKAGSTWGGAAVECAKGDLDKKAAANDRTSAAMMVEVTGFEPATFWSRTKRATKLRYTSNYGANEGTRTLDLRFTKPLLYRLSYIGTSQNIIIAI